MAGGDVEAPFPLKGFHKHFNSYTVIGRRNYVLLVWGGTFGAVALYRSLRKKPQTPAVKNA